MKPILFNTGMVRAILEGRKTVTRRVVKPQPMEQEENPQKITSGNWYFDIPDRHFGGIGASVGPYRPPYRPGDILYVRETWARSMAGTYLYKATDTPLILDGWCPSIHMPREAARIFLRVTEVRVERLQDITEEQARAEGVKGWMVATDRDWDKNPNHLLAFRHAWNSTLKKSDRALYGWDANPWVWAIEFERCEKSEGD